MEKAKLTKRGKGWSLQIISTGKQLSCSWKQIPNELDGKEVEILLDKGQPSEIRFGDKVISKEKVLTSNINLQMENKNLENKNEFKYGQNNNIAQAVAPYNFVPLNSKLIEAQTPPANGHATYDPERLSGYIELSIEALTPLFIRGKGNRFLLLNDKPVIPGSSLRGMTRTLVEILTFGKFQSFEDKQLYKRGTLMEMTGSKAPKPGFLKYKGGKDYEIIKASLAAGILYNPVEFSYVFNESKCLCTFSTGKFGNENPREFEFSLITPTSSKQVPEEVLKSYEDDIQRDGLIPDVFECARKMKIRGATIPNSLGMPVFYTEEEGKVISVSHAKYGRIPYSLKISDHILPKGLFESDQMDFAEAIFGTTKRATRVYFEDALVNYSGQNNIEMAEKQPKILSSPKPTSYQLYLEQNSGKKRKWGTKEVPIRGYKLYWHRITPEDPNNPYSWVEQTNHKSDSHPDSIKAVRPGTKFSGRVRFDNLTREELGCLLIALELPENCCHKLGMGKPLGLGSVKISPVLKIINRKKRYQNLFGENGGWESGFEADNKIQDYQNNFANYVIGKLGKDNNGTIVNLWDEERIKHLMAMLFWNENKMESNKWLENTRYMEIERKDTNPPYSKKNEYKVRPILPDALTVLNK